MGAMTDLDHMTEWRMEVCSGERGDTSHWLRLRVEKAQCAACRKIDGGLLNPGIERAVYVVVKNWGDAFDRTENQMLLASLKQYARGNAVAVSGCDKHMERTLEAAGWPVVLQVGRDTQGHVVRGWVGKVGICNAAEGTDNSSGVLVTGRWRGLWCLWARDWKSDKRGWLEDCGWLERAVGIGAVVTVPDGLGRECVVCGVWSRGAMRWDRWGRPFCGKHQTKAGKASDGVWGALGGRG